MKIKLLGFRLHLKPAMSLPSLIGQLKTISGQAVIHDKITRILTVEETDRHLVGSLLAIKGGTKFTQIDTKSLKMSVQELQAGQSLAVFNFFVLAKNNRNGLYSHYHTATNLQLFTDFLDSQGVKLVAPALKAELDNVTETGELGKSKRKQIRELYRECVTSTILVSAKKLHEIIKDWKRLRSLEFKVTTLDPGEKTFGGLKPFVEAKTTRLSFGADSVLGKLKEALTSFVSDGEFERAKVEGTDESDIERAINVINTPDWFGELDYAEILKDPSLFSQNVQQSRMAKELLQSVEKHPHYFNIDVK